VPRQDPSTVESDRETPPYLEQAAERLDESELVETIGHRLGGRHGKRKGKTTTRTSSSRDTKEKALPCLMAEPG
jgi:hypothetical protein